MSNSIPPHSTDKPDLTKRRSVAAVLAVIALIAVGVLTWWIDGQGSPDSEATAASSTSSVHQVTGTAPGSSTAAPAKNVPAHVAATLKFIDAGQWPEAANAPGTKGGVSFRNSERQLPLTDSSGRKLRYREWDVNPKKPGRGRDAERIVTSSDGSAWYTKDHYKSFTLIRGPSA